MNELNQNSPFRILFPLFFNTFLVAVLTSPVSAFTIKDPSSSTILKPGQGFTVRIDVGNIGDIIRSKFYWYADQEDMLEEFVDEKLTLVSTSSHVPPYGGKVRVPRTAIGRFRLLAVAEIEGNALDQEHWAIFDELTLTIEPDSELQEIDFETEKPLGFGRAGFAAVYDQVDFLGKVIELPVVGIFADGVVRPIRLQATGTTYLSSDEKVVTVNPDGLLRLAPYSPKASFLAPLVEDSRIFRFKLHVTDIQGADSFPVFVNVTVEP